MQLSTVTHRKAGLSVARSNALIVTKRSFAHCPAAMMQACTLQPSLAASAASATNSSRSWCKSLSAGMQSIRVACLSCGATLKVRRAAARRAQALPRPARAQPSSPASPHTRTCPSPAPGRRKTPPRVRQDPPCPGSRCSESRACPCLLVCGLQPTNHLAPAHPQCPRPHPSARAARSRTCLRTCWPAAPPRSRFSAPRATSEGARLTPAGALGSVRLGTRALRVCAWRSRTWRVRHRTPAPQVP